MNDIITGIRNALADFLKLLRQDNAKTVADLTSATKSIPGPIVSAIHALPKPTGIESRLDQLIRVISSKDNAVSMENVDVITSELREGLGAVVEALREEVGKMEKQIVVKNDLGQLFGLFKGNKDKGDMLKSLARLEAAIESIEFPQAVDYTLILSDIAKAVESKTTKKLEQLLTAISEKNIQFPNQMNVALDPNLVDDYRVRIVLSDEQVAKMGTVIQGGASFAPIVSPLEKLAQKYALRLVEDSPYTYIGKAVTGSGEGDAVWQIFRMDDTSGLAIEWADGNSSFDNIWSNYATLSYS
jgi:hypothetical protein